MSLNNTNDTPTAHDDSSLRDDLSIIEADSSSGETIDILVYFKLPQTINWRLPLIRVLEDGYDLQKTNEEKWSGIINIFFKCVDQI